MEELKYSFMVRFWDGVADLHSPLHRRAGETSDPDHSGVGAVHEQVRRPLGRDAALQHLECAVQSAVEG
jgi:hypothetical protein